MKNAKKTEQLKKLVDLVCDISMLFEVTAEKTPEEKIRMQIALFLLFEELSRLSLRGIKTTLKQELKKEMEIAKKYLQKIEKLEE